jgi:hypothetical protein
MKYSNPTLTARAITVARPMTHQIKEIAMKDQIHNRSYKTLRSQLAARIIFFKYHLATAKDQRHFSVREGGYE